MSDTKKTITTAERLQLIGLLALAADLSKQIQAIERATATLLNESDEGAGSGYFGHVTDAVYGSHGADKLLRLLDIAVVDTPAEPVTK